MDSKSQVSRSRQKRTQKRTRGTGQRPIVLTTRVLLCYFGLLALLLVTLNVRRGTVFTDLTPGQLAPTTLQALVDFETTDLAATELERERVGKNVPPVVLIRKEPLSEARRQVESFLEQTRKQLTSTEDDAALDYVEALRLIGLGEELSTFPESVDLATLDQLQPPLLRQLERVWQAGILSQKDRETGMQGAVTRERIQLGEDGPLRNLSSFPVPQEAASTAVEALSTPLDLSEDLKANLEVLFLEVLRPNLVTDPLAHRRAREVAMARVEPVQTLRRQGTTLIEARTPVTEQAMRDLRAHEQKRQELERNQHQLSDLIGQVIYLATGLAISLALLYLLDPQALRKVDQLLLWALLTEGSLLIGQGLVYLSADLNLFQGHFLRPLLPLALAPMLATILYGPRLGLAVGLASSLTHALHLDLNLTTFFIGLALTLTSAISVRAIHRRSNLFRAGLWIGAVQALIIIAAGSIELYTGSIIAMQSLAAFATGLITALIVLLLISPFEYLFKVTTDIRLLELSDMTHPLLSRLALEAPGTYHHSLMVAHLAQAAAREIGANDLLVRVCAYYHDIGKLTKPEFFIENGQGRQNPHDDLSPSMSRLLIISHVKEGVSLARRYKLPGILIDGIEQHHGTSVIQYFYHRARSQAEDSKETVKAEDFRYPGPRPQSAEMGLLMMADAIEAASRSIDRNKPGQVEGLVREIIKEKLEDGQFDLCQITMGQISAARRSFIFSLKNMLHGRVEYPKENDTKDPSASSKPTQEAPAKKDGN